MRKLSFMFLLLVLTACKSKGILTDFEIGMNENTWREAIKSKLKNQTSKLIHSEDSLSFTYKMNIGAIFIDADLSINHDGIEHGKLRVLSLSFESDKGVKKADVNSVDPSYPSPAEEQTIYEKLTSEHVIVFKSKTGRIIGLAGLAFPKASSELIYSYLTDRYGSPDSVLDIRSNRIDNIDWKTHSIEKNVPNKKNVSLDDLFAAEDKSMDTSAVRYFFHNSSSIIVYLRSQYYASNYFIPFVHCSKANLYQYSNHYETELLEEKTKLLGSLRPSDLITIPLYYSIEHTKGHYGISIDYLRLSADLDPQLRKTTVQNKEIQSLKGKIVLMDKYHSVLQEIPNVDIYAKGSFPEIKGPGLLKAIGEEGSYTYTINEFQIRLNLGYVGNTPSLKQAIALKEQMVIEFIPDAIMFSDGSILK